MWQILVSNINSIFFNFNFKDIKIILKISINVSHNIYFEQKPNIVIKSYNSTVTINLIFYRPLKIPTLILFIKIFVTRHESIVLDDNFKLKDEIEVIQHLHTHDACGFCMDFCRQLCSG
jgi:hypothetical protein